MQKEASYAQLSLILYPLMLKECSIYMASIIKKLEEIILIIKMIWDEQVYASKDTVLLVLSDTKYDKNDYIESWETYCKLINR